MLCKGLKFTPTPRHDSDKLRSDIKEFSRKLRLKEYFEDDAESDDSLVSNPSTFVPPTGRDKHLDTFIDYINNIPVGQNNRQMIRSSLNKEERIALKRLRSRSDIIIKEADKGSGVVVMNKDFYKSNIESMLSDESSYKETNENPDKKTLSKLKHLVQNTDANLTRKEKDYITNFEAKTSQFYGLPKVHKSETIKDAINEQMSKCTETEDPPDLTFRPIVAGPACPTHRLSNLIDILLRPFIKYVKSYVRDDIDFLNHLPTSITDQDIFVTMDVNSLYSNIDHDLGKRAIEFWLDKFPGDIHGRFTKSFILEGMDIILRNNNFQFGGKNYIQIFGTAMGTKFAPTYATLVLGYLETILYERIESKYNTQTKEIVQNTFKRYLDDVFMILDCSVVPVEELLSLLNSLHPKLTFTHETSDTSLPFLDILVMKRDNMIVTDIYYKPTDTKQYLNYKSCHPRSTKNNVPFNLARRICTIVSDKSLQKKRLSELKVTLLTRDYPEGVIDKGIQMASQIDITSLRTPKQRDQCPILPFISTFNPNSPDVFHNIYHNIHSMYGSARMRSILKETRIIKSNRQGPNLKKLLTKARFQGNNENKGAAPCQNPRCKCCQDMQETTQVFFHTLGITFDIRSEMDCDSQNLIYVLFCEGCREYYIGQTGDKLRARCRVHRQGILHNSSIAVDRHIHTCAKNMTRKFSIIPFFKMTSQSKQDRLSKENYFIQKFKPLLNQE